MTDHLPITCSVYDLPLDVLASLVPKPEAEGQAQLLPEQNTESLHDRSSSDPTTDDAVGAQACSLCGLTFPNVQDQKNHLRSDFHHYNLKQKLRGRKPVSEAEFEELLKGN